MPEIYSNLELVIADLSFNSVIIGSALLAILTTLSISIKKQSSTLKKLLFISFCLVTVITTLFLAASTVYLNNISSSKGPVHWHADLEIWQCGKELNLKNPVGWSNKIGTATLHEHNDKRIHLEGVVIEKNDASLGKFFNVIGGKIDSYSVTIPTDEGLKSFKNGKDICLELSQYPEVQTFVYHVEGNEYFQYPIRTDPEKYLLSPYSQVPPGDCIIIEFSPFKNETDKICQSFKVAEQLGKIKKRER